MLPAVALSMGCEKFTTTLLARAAVRALRVGVKLLTAGGSTVKLPDTKVSYEVVFVVWLVPTDTPSISTLSSWLLVPEQQPRCDTRNCTR